MRVSYNCGYMEWNADDSTLPSFTTPMDTGLRSLLTVESPLSRWFTQYEVEKLVHVKCKVAQTSWGQYQDIHHYKTSSNMEYHY